MVRRASATVAMAILAMGGGQSLAQGDASQQMPGPNAGATQAAGGAVPAGPAGTQGGVGADPGANAGQSVARAWSIVPRLSVTQTFSDNVALSASGARQADQITEISPGIRVAANTGRLTGLLDYSLRNAFYARGSSGNNQQNALNANGTLRAVDNWLYLDASASISRQAISAFGAQSQSTANLNSNSTETTTIRVSPYVRGRFGSVADYNFRYSYAETKSASALTATNVTQQFSGSLNGQTALAFLRWTLDGSRQSLAYGNGRTSELDQINAGLVYTFDPQLRFNFKAGSESNDYASATKQSNSTFSYGADWTPTERTQISAVRERRFFGDGHRVSINHRFPLSVIRFTDSRDVAVQPNTQAGSAQGTYYDLLFAQLAASVPDPVLRAQQVNAQLQQAGIAPNAPVTNGFLASRATIQRRQELSLILNGLRNTVTYTLFQSNSETFGAAAAGTDDFSTATSIKQRGMSSNFSHRLSPLTALNAFSMWSRTEGNTGAQSTTQRSFNVNVSTTLHPKINASFGMRATRAESTVSPYRENVVFGTLATAF